jgi:hypothetical protein
MTEPHRFWVVVAIAALSQLSVAYTYASAPLIFLTLIVLWNIAPLLVAVIMYVAGARSPAWGWLVAVAIFGLWSVLAVLRSDSSTAALGFMWTPIWSFLIAGPIGAGIAILAVKERSANQNGQK